MMRPTLFFIEIFSFVLGLEEEEEEESDPIVHTHRLIVRINDGTLS